MSEATAEAAQEQVRIADNMARRQLRAYLAVEGAKIFILKPDEVVVKLVIANKGSTPARIVDLNYNLRLGPQRTIAPWEDGIPLKKRYWDGKTIGHANIESVLFWENLDTSTISKDNNDLYLYGIMNYSDVFNDNHWVRFCYNLKGYTIEAGDDMEKMPSGNKISF